jgi:fatty-acyl-CoA synthase
MNLQSHLRFWATRWPQRLAIECAGRTITWGALDAGSDQIAAGLMRAGVGAGDRVGILMRNRIEFAEVLFGVLKAGAAVTLLNIRFTAKELAYPVVDSGLEVIITEPVFANVLEECLRRVPGLAVFMSEALEGWATLDSLRIGTAAAPDVPVSDDDVALVSYTSGTTGFPKGAMLTHGNLREAGLAVSVPMGVTYEDRLLVSLPLAYTWGTCVYLQEGLLTGATTFVDTTFTADSLIELFERARITLWSTVPRLLELVADHPRFRTADLSSLRHVSTGNASLHLLESWQDVGVPITQGYGLTESTGHATLLFAEDARRKIGSSGRPLMPVRLRIVDGNGAALPAGEPGEIRVKGPTIMRGYLNKPEETAEALVDGWLKTGDVGVLDEEGYLSVIDRHKDMLRSGGLNVYPAEIERVLAGVSGLEDFAVIGVDDERWGEVPMIVAHGSRPLDLEGLKRRLGEELADYKRPRYLMDYGRPLPRTVSGKILKRELRLEFRAAPARARSLKD